jgi:hypothetical protein
MFFIMWMIRQGIIFWLIIPSQKEKGNSLALAGELGLEFFYPSSGVHKAFLTSKCRVGIHSDITHKHMAIDTIHIFSLLRTGSRNGVKLLARRYIDKGNGIESWMNIFLHL